MKQIQTAIKLLTAFAFAVIAVGCAAELQNKQNLAAAAGFKIVTPATPTQQAILAKLPPRKVTPVIYHGQTYYVLPDAKNNQAYVGGQAQYQAYRQLRLQQQLTNDNLEAAQMNEAASMEWGAWGGWGGMGFYR